MNSTHGRCWSKIAKDLLRGRCGLACKNRYDHIERKRRRKQNYPASQPYREDLSSQVKLRNFENTTLELTSKNPNTRPGVCTPSMDTSLGGRWSHSGTPMCDSATSPARQHSTLPADSVKATNVSGSYHNSHGAASKAQQGRPFFFQNPWIDNISFFPPMQAITNAPGDPRVSLGQNLYSNTAMQVPTSVHGNTMQPAYNNSEGNFCSSLPSSISHQPILLTSLDSEALYSGGIMTNANVLPSGELDNRNCDSSTRSQEVSDAASGTQGQSKRNSTPNIKHGDNDFWKKKSHKVSHANRQSPNVPYYMSYPLQSYVSTDPFYTQAVFYAKNRQNDAVGDLDGNPSKLETRTTNYVSALCTTASVATTTTASSHYNWSSHSTQPGNWPSTEVIQNSLEQKNQNSCMTVHKAEVAEDSSTYSSEVVISDLAESTKISGNQIYSLSHTPAAKPKLTIMPSSPLSSSPTAIKSDHNLSSDSAFADSKKMAIKSDWTEESEPFGH